MSQDLYIILVALGDLVEYIWVPIVLFAVYIIWEVIEEMRY